MAVPEDTSEYRWQAYMITFARADIVAYASDREQTAGTSFIFTDGIGKVELAKRKLIRRHVMIGKNRGKPRNVKPLKPAASCNPEAPSQEDQDGAPGLMIKMHHFMIPNKVGSDLSFTQFADTVEPALLHDILKCRP